MCIRDRAWKAEVEEFNEPGGMMDHYTSALGGLVHLNFSDPKNTTVERLDVQLDGCFILFDSKQQKDTIKVLGNSKYPTQEAIQQLNSEGITSIRDFYSHPELVAAVGKLDDFHRQKVEANINNYRIQREADVYKRQSVYSSISSMPEEVSSGSSPPWRPEVISLAISW